ncbi:MAG: hypothetical protein P4L11_00700, partial [Geothrix sp.]|nr:hypothetical protein [Geothrix sp.]
WLAPLSLLLLAACSPLTVAPGTPEAQVRERFGSPSAVYRLPGTPAETRLEYDTGPTGQRTYMVDFGPDDRAVKAWQALTREHFDQVQPGVDTTDSVRREFGQPKLIRPSFHLGPGYTVWEYPYSEAEIWNSLVSITFDPKGTVRYVENGQDPRLILNK